MLSGRGKKNKWIIWVDGQAKPADVGYELKAAEIDAQALIPLGVSSSSAGKFQKPTASKPIGTDTLKVLAF